MEEVTPSRQPASLNPQQDKLAMVPPPAIPALRRLQQGDCQDQQGLCRKTLPQNSNSKKPGSGEWKSEEQREEEPLDPGVEFS